MQTGCSLITISLLEFAVSSSHFSHDSGSDCQTVWCTPSAGPQYRPLPRYRAVIPLRAVCLANTLPYPMALLTGLPLRRHVRRSWCLGVQRLRGRQVSFSPLPTHHAAHAPHQPSLACCLSSLLALLLLPPLRASWHFRFSYTEGHARLVCRWSTSCQPQSKSVSQYCATAQRAAASLSPDTRLLRALACPLPLADPLACRSGSALPPCHC